MFFNKSNAGKCFACGAKVGPEEKLCKKCKRDDWVECEKDRCGNCHAYLNDSDKYCRICGTAAGEGAYNPYQNLMQCIYGPMPVKRVHTCKKCNYEWTTSLMIDDEKYCPKCGGKAPVTSEGKRF